MAFLKTSAGSLTNESAKPIGIGIVGTGVIFDAYARGLGLDPRVEILRVADLDTLRAREAAARWGIPKSGTAEELLADGDISVVVNITPPAAHSSLTRAALNAGKHVYVEKPLALTREDAQGDIELARARGLKLGCAPDTYLGQAGQTARYAVDAGLIGEVFAASSFIISSRTETWHPNPGAFFAPGGGPALDLGPYHLAHLINLLGPVRGVLGASRTVRSRLPVSSAGRTADFIDVSIPTHTSAVLCFDSAIATAMYSFEIWDAELPHLEIYGTEGTLMLPKANRFDEPVRIIRRNEEVTVLEPVISRTTPEPASPYRALGVLDLVESLSGGTHQTSADRAFHILDVLDTVSTLDEHEGYRPIFSTCSRPEPVSAAPRVSA